ncbi:hypothetical protein M422DRAFT_276395 [Sphaerobolus stellatus SS14]|uniref:Uncharacterized protein n=1 Tax=Sphaerobolus stellatus (strain SS14) TaxID=990650 RepID=A0A0C9UDA8_SPHS4|nr:hypothetical protein M422DRAFT_276395 [Sphaerobolus stellatus SS14]
MSHQHGPRRVRAEELSTADIEDSEPTTGLTTRDLTNSPFPSVDPQQSLRMLLSEYPEDPHAATQRIIDQMAMIEPVPRSGAEERARTTCSCIPGDRYSSAPLFRNIPEDIPNTAHGKQGEDSQPRCSHETHTVYARDTPEARVRDMSCAHLTCDIHVTERTRMNSTEST